jgi:glucose-6-phosphate 1-dehydrogenase
VKYPPDASSSHKYEVKKVHTDGATFDAVVFYLRAGEPVNIDVEEVLKKTNLWIEPTTSNPRKAHHLIFEVEPEDDTRPVELYISRLDIDLKESGP